MGGYPPANISKTPNTTTMADEEPQEEEDEQPETLYENFQLPRPPPYYHQFTEKNLQRLKDLKDLHGHDIEDATTKASILLDLPSELRCLVPPEPPEDGIVLNFGDTKTVRLAC